MICSNGVFGMTMLMVLVGCNLLVFVDLVVFGRGMMMVLRGSKMNTRSDKITWLAFSLAMAFREEP